MYIHIENSYNKSAYITHLKNRDFYMKKLRVGRNLGVVGLLVFSYAFFLFSLLTDNIFGSSIENNDNTKLVETREEFNEMFNRRITNHVTSFAAQIAKHDDKALDIDVDLEPLIFNEENATVTQNVKCTHKAHELTSSIAINMSKSLFDQFKHE